VIILALRYMRVGVLDSAQQPITGYGFTSTVTPSALWDLMSVAGDMDPHGHNGVDVYSKVTHRPNWQNIRVPDADRVSRNLVLSTWWERPRS